MGYNFTAQWLKSTDNISDATAALFCYPLLMEMTSLNRKVMHTIIRQALSLPSQLEQEMHLQELHRK